MNRYGLTDQFLPEERDRAYRKARLITFATSVAAVGATAIFAQVTAIGYQLASAASLPMATLTPPPVPNLPAPTQYVDVPGGVQYFTGPTAPVTAPPPTPPPAPTCVSTPSQPC